MSHRTVTPKLIHAQSDYIDPIHCGSKISAQMCRTKWNTISGTVEISDCNRSIKWELWQHDHHNGLEKLDKAIACLLLIRTAWKDAIEQKVPTRRKKKK